MYDYDVLFIGTGHACWHAAVTLSAAGKRIALVEEDTVAGTCTNFGCNAKMTLDTPFEYAAGLSTFVGSGLAQAPVIDWHELMEMKKATIGPMHLGLERMFEQAGMALYRGKGRLVDAHTVQAGDDIVTAEHIVLGTGEHPNRRDIPGKELLHDSRDLLSLDPFPESIAFIGAGIISMEFACIAAKLGAKTYVIHHNDRALRKYPAAYVDKVVATMRADGVEFLFGESVAAAEADGEGVALTFESGMRLSVDYVVDATGRTPNVAGIGLEDVGIEHSRRGIKVDDHMRTSVSNIYASGDCVDKPIAKLTPTAEFESNYIADQILGLSTDPISYPAIPDLVFTLPRIARVGVDVDAAREDPRYRVVEVPFGQRSLFMSKNDPDVSFTYVLEGDQLVGCAIYAMDAGELINVAALIIDQQISVSELRQKVFSFPGITYGFVFSLIGNAGPSA